jgi:hypothetical protein
VLCACQRALHDCSVTTYSLTQSIYCAMDCYPAVLLSHQPLSLLPTEFNRKSPCEESPWVYTSHTPQIAPRRPLYFHIVQPVYWCFNIQVSRVLQCKAMRRMPSAVIPSALDHPNRTLLPQPLQLPKHNDVCVQEAVDTLPHARLFVFIELSVLDRAGGDAFAETCVCQAVDGCNSVSDCTQVTGSSPTDREKNSTYMTECAPSVPR